MQYIDISRTLNSEIVVWPGDTQFSLSPILERSLGHSVNLTTIRTSAHTGSHVDAPRHFTDDGESIEGLQLQPFWGTAQVVTVSKVEGPLLPQDLDAYDLGAAERLLVHSLASDLDPRIFPAEFVYPSPELAHYLGERGVILYGSDTPSMDREDSKTLDGHRALHRNNIAILEWLDLSRVEDGFYELSALPLKIACGDGSPVRAVLRR
jgi:arylformamidase